MSSGFRMRSSAQEIQRTIIEQRAEREVTRRAPTARFGQPRTRTGGAPPPTNVTAVQGASKAVRLRWDASAWATVDEYIIDIATDPSFVGAETRTTRETRFNWDEGTASTTYYFRVRTRPVGGDVGLPSSTVSFAIP